MGVQIGGDWIGAAITAVSNRFTNKHRSREQRTARKWDQHLIDHQKAINRKSKRIAMKDANNQNQQQSGLQQASALGTNQYSPILLYGAIAVLIAYFTLGKKS